MFKRGLAKMNHAMEYFVLDGYVSENVVLRRDVSRMYKYLAAFEEDPKRACAMNGRRVDLLEPLLVRYAVWSCAVYVFWLGA